MCNRLFAVAAAVLLAPAFAPAADPPPVVFQAQPLERVLGDLRTAAELIGGEKGVAAVNKGITNLFGEKGFEGLDISRPIVGYVVLAPKPEDITAVVALPVTGEKEFLGLCERANKQKPKADAKDPGLYELPPLYPGPGLKALLRFSGQYAYIAFGANPAPHIDPKALAPAAQLYDPADPGLVSARLNFDRIPPAVRLALPALLANVKKTLFGENRLGVLGLFGFAGAQGLVNEKVDAEIDKLLARYVKLSAGADVLAARVILDAPSGNISVEATLKGKPGSELSTIIAAFKPTGNKFAGLLNHPDTVAGFKVRLPLFEEEIRNAAAAGIEVGQKVALKNVREVEKAMLEELFKGLGRTVKTGEFDIVGAVRGPDKNGWFTAVGAVAFEDPSALGKEFKTFVQKDAPPDFQQQVKWDAAKAGTVSIHQWKVQPQRGFIFGDFTKVFGGDDCSVAFAFAPHGVFVAVGPDAIGTMKDALAVKPADSPVLDVVLNPAKLGKLVQKMDPNDPQALAEVEKRLGRDDKLFSAMSATLEGGQELKAKLVINLWLLPRALFIDEIERTDRSEARPAPVKK